MKLPSVLKMCVLVFVLSVFTQISAQDLDKTTSVHQQSSASLVTTKDDLINACSVSSQQSAPPYQRCGDLSNTSITSRGIHVEVTGGQGRQCTTVSLVGGDSISTCLSNGVSVVQICRQEDAVMRGQARRVNKSTKQNEVKKAAFKCENFINGEKGV